MTGDTIDGLPTDRGWAWVICLACMVEVFLYAGVDKSFGLFFVEYAVMFNASASMVSVIISLQMFVASVTGLLVMTIGKHCYTTRVYTIFGGIVLCISYLVNAYSPNIYFVMIGSGVLFGFGTAFTLSPATAIVGEYFERKRGLANGIYKVGAGTGSLVFPPFIRLLFDTYGVRGGLMILAGVLLNIATCGALLRPPTFYTKQHRIKYNTSLAGIVRTKLNTDDPGVDKSFLEIESRKQTTDDETRKLKALNGEIQREKASKTNSEYSSSSESDLELYSNKHMCNVNSVTEKAEVNVKNTGSYEEAKGCLYVWNHLNFRDIIAKIFDKEILNNYLFRIYVPSSVLGTLGFSLVTSFIPPHAKDVGIDNQRIALLVSIYGGSDIFGRFIMAFVSDSEHIRRSLLLAISLLLTGILCQLLPLFTSFWSLVIFSSINGIFAGFQFTIYPLVIIDFVGIHHFSSALGILSLCHGIGFLVATPLLGKIRDQTSSYLGTFHVIGACLIVGAGFLLLDPVIRKYQRRKEHESIPQNDGNAPQFAKQ